MPTYQNPTSGFITSEGVMFEPYQTLVIDKYLTDQNLTLLSDTPYYNPYLADSTISVSTTADYTYIIANPGCGSVKINLISGTCKFYINSKSNLPINLTEIIKLLNQNRIKTLIFTASATSNVNIKELN